MEVIAITFMLCIIAGFLYWAINFTTDGKLNKGTKYICRNVFRPRSVQTLRDKNDRLRQKIAKRQQMILDMERRQELLEEQNKLRAQLGQKIAPAVDDLAKNIKRLERELEADGVKFS